MSREPGAQKTWVAPSEMISSNYGTSSFWQKIWLFLPMHKMSIHTLVCSTKTLLVLIVCIKKRRHNVQDAVVFGGIHKWRHFPKIYTPSSLHSPHHPLFISNSYILRSPRKFEQSSSYLILTLLGGLLKRTLRLTGFLKFWTQPH